MQVLITGATGFIGSRLADAFEAAGHAVVGTARDAAAARARHPSRRWIGIDFARATTPAHWLPHLAGIDCVINAAGIVRETAEASFDAVHTAGPQALFRACAEHGGVRVLQISALGADDAATTRFHLSKRAADAELLALPVAGAVLQPSLVFGPGGASTLAMLRWAALPVLPVLQGAGAVQPVHVDELVVLVLRLASAPSLPRTRIAVVGAQPLALADYLQALRAGLGLAPAPQLPVPRTLTDAAAALGDGWPGALLTRQTWQMLQRGNTASAAEGQRLQALLGRAPRAATAFVPAAEAPAWRALAREPQIDWLLRGSLALVWIATAIVSVAVYPREDSLALLARTGAHGGFALLLLWGAAAMDLVFGILTLLKPARWLWWAQLALVAFYSVVIAWRLPEYLAHPYAPIVKNAVIVAALASLLVMQPRRGMVPAARRQGGAPAGKAAP
jgi:uncharacterized protein YbjT (DUF2867 family)